VDIVTGLPAVRDCADTSRLAGPNALGDDPALRERVSRARAQLEAAGVASRGGRMTEGFELTTATVAEARTIGYAPLLAEALLIHARARGAHGDAEGAVATLREAIAVAEAARHDAIKAEASVNLIIALIGVARPKEAADWLPMAFAAVERIGNEPRRLAVLRAYQGSVELQLGRPTEARVHQEAGLASAIEAYGADHLLVASPHNNLAITLRKLGDYEGAIEHNRRALAIREAQLGTEHPNAAISRLNLGNALWSAGRATEALAEYDRALVIRTAVYGPTHKILSEVELNRGAALQALGRAQEAVTALERALSLFGGGDERVLAGIHESLGLALHKIGRDREAIEHLRRAVTMLAAIVPAGHIDLANARGDLGNVLVETGALREGLVELEACVSDHEKALGGDSPVTAAWATTLGLALLDARRVDDARRRCEHAKKTLAAASPGTPNDLAARACLGRVLLAAGEARSSMGAFDEALAIAEKAELSPGAGAELRFWAARSVYAAGDRGRARALATAARDQLVGVDGGASLRAEVEAWLAKNR
jgi:tetratricopeptide (TPR) repeat protein